MGRFKPLLTVLVEASSRDEALRLAELSYAGSKGISAEDIRPLQTSAPVLRLVAPPEPEGVAWGHCGVAAHV
jgi:hypothetical protein